MKRSIEDTPVVFIGAGNLATNLAKALYYKGFALCKYIAGQKSPPVRWRRK